MIFSRTTQYTVQALIFVVAQPAGQSVLNQYVAEKLGVPPAYLAKVLQQLVRAGLLDSTRGRSGGFRANERTRGATLIQVLTLIEGPGLADSCVLGLKVCSAENACPLHATWSPVKTRIISLLTLHTIEKLARAVTSGRYRIGDLPAALLAGLPAASAPAPKTGSARRGSAVVTVAAPRSRVGKPVGAATSGTVKPVAAPRKPVPAAAAPAARKASKPRAPARQRTGSR